MSLVPPLCSWGIAFLKVTVMVGVCVGGGGVHSHSSEGGTSSELGQKPS